MFFLYKTSRKFHGIGYIEKSSIYLIIIIIIIIIVIIIII